MNVENILKVADAIEQHSIPDLGFNMGSWVMYNASDRDLSGHGCGTVACIGGWTDAVMGKTFYRATSDTAADLGLDMDVAHSLFFGGGLYLNDYDGATPAQAVRTLRHLAATGTVDWDLPEA